jgi:Kef-type K+ transport system membrane component KefB
MPAPSKLAAPRQVVLPLGVLFSTPALAAGGSGQGATVIHSIAVAMVAASVLGFLMKLLRQPLLLGYVLAGVLIGPIGLRLITEQAQIQTISQIGLILLLFMIGLEIDLKKMLQAGRLVVLTGLLQFPLSVAIAAALFAPLQALGLPLGGGHAVLYLAVGVSISSTMIVVKLLFEKFELDTVAGRLTVGILIFQDLWAIVVLAVQPNLARPELGGLLRTFLAGAVLVGASLLASRYALPRVFRVIAKVPELMMVLSLGWCFLVGLVAALPAVGLSMEMGALIAGVSLATFPYNLDVNAKVLNIRDFFITLFFVSLGMQIPAPTGQTIAMAAVASIVLLLTRLGAVFGVLYAQRAGHWASLLPTINLAQMSEFALVIAAIGLGLGHIPQSVLTVTMWTFAFMAVVSTYLITASHRLEHVLSRWMTRLGLRDLRSTVSEIRRAGDRPVVILGFYRIASAFLNDVSRRGQHLLETLKVVDFNPDVRVTLAMAGVPCIYGDISNPDTLHHANIQQAKVLISTVPDSALRGTTNLKLLKMLRELAPEARLILTAETAEQAVELYGGGADYVLQPSVLAGEALFTAVEQALRGSCEGMREEAEVELASRTGKHATAPASA